MADNVDTVLRIRDPALFDPWIVDTGAGSGMEKIKIQDPG
jgi:hypothetical protein